MKRNLACAFFIALSLKGSAQDAPVTRLNLSQCIEIALENNLNVRRSALQTESARISWQQARANLLPSVNAGITHGINQGRSIDPLTNTYVNNEIVYASPYLNGSLLLFNGMKFQNLIKQNALIYQAVKEEKRQEEDNITLNVVITYLQVLTNQDLLELEKRKQEITLKQVERLEILNKNGAIAPGNYFDLKGQYAADRISVINAGNVLESSKISLAEQLNIPYTKDLQLENLSAEQLSPLLDSSAQQVYQSALQNYAAIKATDLRKKNADIQLKTIRSGYLPSIYLNTGISSNFSNVARDIEGRTIGYFEQFNNNQSKGFSVGMSFPVFNSFRTKNAGSLARLNLRENEVLAQTIRIQLQHIIEQAYFNMTASKERDIALQEQKEAFAESFRIAEVRFAEGVINSVDYLAAKNNLDIANSNLVTNRYDLILRKKILEIYQGK